MAQLRRIENAPGKRVVDKECQRRLGLSKFNTWFNVLLVPAKNSAKEEKINSTETTLKERRATAEL